MFIRIITACTVMAAIPGWAHAANPPERGVEAKLVVTVADHMNHKPRVLKAEDFADSASMRIVNVTTLFGRKELYILIDDAANYDFGEKLGELKMFLNSQPASAAVGLAYIRDGELKVVQAPVNDRQPVLRALRAPAGSKPANPWCALSSLIAGWTPGTERREVLMITSGIDNGNGAAPACANADAAIRQAQRAGVEVFAIYHPVADYVRQEWKKVDSGVIELSHVCYETGGEAYFLAHSAAETITPFLNDIAEHLDNQYRMTVRFDTAAEPGLRDLYLHPVSPELEFMAPSKVWVGTVEH